MGGFFEFGKLEARIGELETETGLPDFWSNNEKKNAVIAELKRLKAQTGVLQGDAAQRKNGNRRAHHSFEGP